MAIPATRTLRDAVLERLDLVDNLKVYDGEVPQDDPPDVIPGSNGRVRPYAVLYASGGRGYSDRIVGGSSALSWSPQITVAAGYQADLGAAIDRVRAELTDQVVAIPDGVTGYLREPSGERPVLVDKTVTPTRFSYPLIFQIVATP